MVYDTTYVLHCTRETFSSFTIEENICIVCSHNHSIVYVLCTFVRSGIYVHIALIPERVNEVQWRNEYTVKLTQIKYMVSDTYILFNAPGRLFFHGTRRATNRALKGSALVGRFVLVKFSIP